MALRLVQPVDGPAAPAPTTSRPTAGPGVELAVLAQRAEALLRARDLQGWRDLLDGTASLADVHHRYVARRILMDRVMAQPEATARALAESYAVAASAVLELLEDEAREPQFLNTAGVLLYELGAIVAAEALFRAAERLDPELPHLERNLRECRRRRKAGAGPLAGLPPAVLRELRTLGPRAQRVAQRAVPATDQTLSLCMIVKDEEAMLPRCLAAVRDHVDELIIVDTGSTDRTVEIAESFGATVLHHEWTGDFAVARNVSFDAATGDWMMFLDADEVLVDGDGPRLRALTGKVWREALFLVETNHTGDLEDGMSVNHNALRVFRNRAEYRFTGRIHEQIADKLPDLPERLEVTNVRIEHFGYLGAVRDAKEKSRRNIELLEKQVAEGADSPFLHFNLGSEFGAANEPHRALEHFQIAWDKINDNPQRARFGFFPSLCSRYVKALQVCGRYDEAIATGARVLELLPGFTDVVFEQASAYRGKGDVEAAQAHLERCIAMGDAPSDYSAVSGAGTFLALGSLAELHRSQGRHAEAEAALRRSLEEYPSFIGAVDPFARAALAQGRPAAEVAATVRRLVPDASPGSRFLLAVPLYEAGAVVEAETELRGVLDAQPGAHAARLALAEALLSQARLADAAAEADAVPVDAPWAPAAARTALFARLAGAPEPAALDAAFARAAEAGLPDAERRAFAAWRAGTPPPDSVPAAAAPLVSVMLEALARLEDFEGFERLAAVAEALALPWRERRELMAGVYLRRGFVESAADEWIQAVEREGADPRALLGLAQVAELRGMDEDAEIFRAEAKALAA